MSRTIDILERLVAFDTVSAKSNLALIDYVQEFLTTRGFAVIRLPDASGGKAGLLASIGPGGAGILLSAHTDVVPVESQVWTHDPFRLSRDNGRLYGRGTTDMKGFLASMLSLADRVEESALIEPLKFSISYDEEIGCLGIAQMIGAVDEHLGTPRAAIVGEPTEMAIATGHKGKVGLVARAGGEAGHSSLAPKFRNAIYELADFMDDFRAIGDWYAANGARDEALDIPYTTFHTGKFSGGTALNIVPDQAEMTFEFRHLPGDARGEIMAKIEAAAGPEISLETIISYPGLATDHAAAVVGLGKRLAATNSQIKVGYGTEAGFFDALGIPTIVCGPGSMEGQGHKPDEYVTEDQLERCDAMMDRVLAELCGASV